MYGENQIGKSNNYSTGQSTYSATQEAARSPEVIAELEALNKTAAELDAVTDHLLGRLAGVVRSTPPEPASTGSNQLRASNATALGASIYEIRQRVQSSSQRLSEIAARLEI